MKVFQCRSRWYQRVCESPYAPQQVSHQCPSVAFKTVAMLVRLMMALPRPFYAPLLQAISCVMSLALCSPLSSRRQWCDVLGFVPASLLQDISGLMPTTLCPQVVPQAPQHFLPLKIVRYAPPQWVAADAEIKIPSGENTELKRSPFKAWSRSVYGHTCYTYCQGFLPCLFHLHFSKTSPDFVLCWLWLTPDPV